MWTYSGAHRYCRHGVEAEAPAEDAEKKKLALKDQYSFCSIRVEHSDRRDPPRSAFTEIGRRLKRETQEPNRNSFRIFGLRISLDIQRGNAALLFNALNSQKPYMKSFFLLLKQVSLRNGSTLSNGSPFMFNTA